LSLDKHMYSLHDIRINNRAQCLEQRKYEGCLVLENCGQGTGEMLPESAKNAQECGEGCLLCVCLSERSNGIKPFGFRMALWY
jgi:hypothetical protein